MLVHLKIETIFVSFSSLYVLESLPTLCMGQLLLCGERGYGTVLPAKSDSGVMFCLQSYQGLIIDRSLVY